MASSRVVNSRPSSTIFEDDEDYRNVPDDVKLETRILLYEFLDERAEHDEAISLEERQSIRESTAECIRNENVPVQKDPAINNIVQMLQEHADSFQKRIDDDLVLQDASEQAIEEEADSGSEGRLKGIVSHLRTVLKRLFDVDENGQYNVTAGKFAAIFYYCYSVCRRFVSRILPRPEIVAIVSTLATSLITYFAKIKFYDWIASHGGWSQAILGLAQSNSWIQTLATQNNLILFSGVVLVGMWAYGRFFKQ